jgi:hypothetical protein
LKDTKVPPGQDANFEDKLAQMLFIVGHIAIKFLVHIDDIENHIKRLKNEVETKKQKNQ